MNTIGDVDVPISAEESGWYNKGPRPGELGSSVIVGHFGSIDGKPAIFNNLQALQKGDIIYTEDDKGASIKFKVSGTRSYEPDENATAVFHTDDGKARLNLITCQGDWQKTMHGYTARLVVFADKV